MTAPVLRVALTGGIATGKSYCLTRFRALGAATIDADVLAREAVRPGSEGLAAVVARFGASVLDGHGALDRAALARIVFADAGARRDLESIIHPFVRAAIAAWTDRLRGDAHSRASSDPILAIADIPLLYEQDRARDFDRVIVAACDPVLQRQRLMMRNGLSADEADRRIAVQLPIAEKRRRADYVIDTSASLGETDRQVDVVWRSLRAPSAPVE
ncbi:MAG: dephospho-CoA kinase [Acidobacteriota bacterium]